jgi:hypothetical protein
MWKITITLVQQVERQEYYAYDVLLLTVAPPGIAPPAPEAPYPMSGGMTRVTLAPVQSPRSPSSPVIVMFTNGKQKS